MAASKSFAFEEREFTASSNAALAPGSVPDFESVRCSARLAPHAPPSPARRG